MLIIRICFIVLILSGIASVVCDFQVKGSYLYNLESFFMNIIFKVGLFFLPIYSFSYFAFIGLVYHSNQKMPPFLKYNRSNDLDAIVQVSVNFLKLKKPWSIENVKKINSFANKVYPKEGSMKNSISNALNYPIKTESCAYWMNKHYSIDRKKEFFDFILLLISEDNVINSSEEKCFFSLVNNFGIPLTDYTYKIDSIKRRYAEQQTKSREQSNSKSNQSRQNKSVNYTLKNALTIFEFENIPTEEELKKKYRSLAKQFHPDTFENKSILEKENAEEHFRSINDAYEFLKEQIN